MSPAELGLVAEEVEPEASEERTRGASAPTWVPKTGVREWVALALALEEASVACEADPEVWFGGDEELTPFALASCERCPVLEECRAYGIAGREQHGIWGGLTRADRLRLARGEVA